MLTQNNVIGHLSILSMHMKRTIHSADGPNKKRSVINDHNKNKPCCEVLYMFSVFILAFAKKACSVLEREQALACVHVKKKIPEGPKSWMCSNTEGTDGSVLAIRWEHKTSTTEETKMFIPIFLFILLFAIYIFSLIP